MRRPPCRECFVNKKLALNRTDASCFLKFITHRLSMNKHCTQALVGFVQKSDLKSILFSNISLLIYEFLKYVLYPMRKFLVL